MAKEKSVELDIPLVQQSLIKLHVLGTSSLLHNQMSAKAKRQFLLPAGRRRTTVERAAGLKHDPISEFRDSAYVIADPQAQTYLGIPSTAFKGAASTAALDLPGTRKTEIGRLLWIGGTTIPVFGTPKLHMGIVRTADMAHTPDIRTRVIMPRWCCEITVYFVKPKLTPQAVFNLIIAAGLLAGVLDGRQEKGKLTFGQFTLTSEGQPNWDEYLDIRNEGRAIQKAAMQKPTCYDSDTEELLSWFDAELERRGYEVEPENEPEDE